MTKTLVEEVADALNKQAVREGACGFEMTAAALRALASRLEGMVIVPREPTEKMIEAARRADASQPPFVRVYRAMLAAGEEK